MVRISTVEHACVQVPAISVCFFLFKIIACTCNWRSDPSQLFKVQKTLFSGYNRIMLDCEQLLFFFEIVEWSMWLWSSEATSCKERGCYFSGLHLPTFVPCDLQLCHSPLRISESQIACFTPLPQRNIMAARSLNICWGTLFFYLWGKKCDNFWGGVGGSWDYFLSIGNLIFFPWG